MLGKVQALHWECHQLVDFPASPETSRVREPFQVKDQEVRGTEDFHFFSSYLVVLALAAVPLVVSFQKFLLREVLETVLQSYLLGWRAEVLDLIGAQIVTINRGTFYHVQVCARIWWSPRHYEDEGKSVARHLSHDVFKGYRPIRKGKVAVVAMLEVAEFTRSRWIVDKTLFYLEVVQNLYLIYRVFLLFSLK